MRIHLETHVEQAYRTVMRQFDRDLFKALVPPGMSIELRRFDGSRKGNQVHLKVKILGLITQEWENLITEDGVNEDEAWFVDEGRKLPFPLKTWRHRHVARRAAKGSVVIDLIDYSTGTLFTDILLYPAMWIQFSLRKPVYRKYFRKKED